MLILHDKFQDFFLFLTKKKFMIKWLIFHLKSMFSTLILRHFDVVKNDLEFISDFISMIYAKYALIDGFCEKFSDE